MDTRGEVSGSYVVVASIAVLGLAGFAGIGTSLDEGIAGTASGENVSTHEDGSNWDGVGGNSIGGSTHGAEGSGINVNHAQHDTSWGEGSANRGQGSRNSWQGSANREQSNRNNRQGNRNSGSAISDFARNFISTISQRLAVSHTGASTFRRSLIASSHASFAPAALASAAIPSTAMPSNTPSNGSMVVPTPIAQLAFPELTDNELRGRRGEIEQSLEAMVKYALGSAAPDSALHDELSQILNGGSISIDVLANALANSDNVLQELGAESLAPFQTLIDEDRELSKAQRRRNHTMMQARWSTRPSQLAREIQALRDDTPQRQAAFENRTTEDLQTTRTGIAARIAELESGNVSLLDKQGGFAEGEKVYLDNPEIAVTRLSEVQRLLATDQALASELHARGSDVVRAPVTISENLQIGLVLVEKAAETLGTPYNNSGSVRFGGTSQVDHPNVQLSGGRFDCSGLTSVLYLQATGLRIETQSTRQLRNSDYESPNDAQLLPGDLIGRPGHVGMYVGGGMYIHAPQTGSVVHVKEMSDSTRRSYTDAARPRDASGSYTIDPQLFTVELSAEELSYTVDAFATS